GAQAAALGEGSELLWQASAVYILAGRGASAAWLSRSRNPPKRLIPARRRGGRRRNPPTLGWGGCQFSDEVGSPSELDALRLRPAQNQDDAALARRRAS